MPASTTFARRLLAGTALLTLCAGPALAQPDDLARVEVRGGALPRQDVHAACNAIDKELQSALARTWVDLNRFGEVQVQFVLENGRIRSVQARGISSELARQVRSAMHKVDCSSSSTPDAHAYRFSVAFLDPNTEPAMRTAARNIQISSGG